MRLVLVRTDTPMSDIACITLPIMPDCWETCGNCADEIITVSQVHLQAGQRLYLDDPMITIEADKTCLDIPSPKSGTVLEVLAKVGDEISEGDPILTLSLD